MDTKEWDKKWNETPRRRIERDEFTIFHVFKDGEKIATVTGKGLAGERKVEYFGAYKSPSKQYSVETMMKLYTVEKIFHEEQFKAARANATKAVKEFWDQFKNALFEYFGIQDHPKRERFFEILLNQKRSPYEIVGEAEEWIDLLK